MAPSVSSGSARRLAALAAAATAAILATLFVLLFLARPSRETIVPASGNRADWNDYDDRDAGGTSRCDVLSSLPFLRIATLTGHAPGAYWGIEWMPAHPSAEGRFWEWSSRDSLVVRWRARKARHLQINICGHDPDLTRPEAPLSRRYLSATLPIGEGWTRASVPLSAFAPPDWWRDLHPDLPGSPLAFLARTLSLQVVPASGSASLGLDTIEIARIERIPARSRLLAIPLALALLFAGLAAWLLRPCRPVAPAALEIAPRSLEAPAPDLERLLDHLSSNYQRDDLDLATVARECALSSRRVTTLLGSRGESFKSLLNRLRLDEAGRLLASTDLQVSEIGFKVGYRNVSHFHRVFRDRFGAAPGAFREALQNRADDLQNLSTTRNATGTDDSA